MPTPLITDTDRALLERAAAYLECEDGATSMAGEDADAAARLLRRLAVEPTDTGLLAFAQGEPNEYFITNNGHWVAAVKFNGELMPAKQEANLRAWLAGASAIKSAQGRLEGLRRLCGYIENGSHTVVTIAQDDATREWVVRVGGSPRSPWFHGTTMLAALDAAIAGTPKEDWE